MSKDDKTSSGTGTGVPQPQAEHARPAAGQSTSGEIADFLRNVKAITPQTGAGRGRLIFAMDATMSRQPTWDMALAQQADMFKAVKTVGGLDVQLVYFRGAGECRASKWVGDPEALAQLMTAVECSVFQIRTPQGQVFTVPLHEIRGFHALSPELIQRISATSRRQRRRAEVPEEMPFGFAAFTSLSRDGPIVVPEAPMEPSE